MTSVGEQIPIEMARVRDQILPAYDGIPEGRVAAMLMRRDLDDAARALATGDVLECIRVYQRLKGWHL